MKKLLIVSSMFTATLLILSSNQYAERPHRGNAKPEFVTACESKSEGDSCSFTDHRTDKTISSTCVSSKNPFGETELTCGKLPAPPQGARGQRPEGPPPSEGNDGN